ncbi:MAG: hypothetical protein ACWA40_06745 [Planktomarina sp.]
MEQTKQIKTYRSAVLLVNLFYCAYILSVSDWSSPGGHFRYLTIWALFMSTFVALRVVLISFEKTANRLDGFVSAVAVVNLMVVYLFWQLYFADPASVTRTGQLNAWWLEAYLHGLGAVLMWFDALFINKVFMRLRQAAVWLFGIVIAFLAWAEFVVAPLNDTPAGSVTSGLPYPFLNNLEVTDRLVFYASNVVFAFIALGLFFLLAAGIRRIKAA